MDEWGFLRAATKEGVKEVGSGKENLYCHRYRKCRWASTNIAVVACQ